MIKPDSHITPKFSTFQNVDFRKNTAEAFQCRLTKTETFENDICLTGPIRVLSPNVPTIFGEILVSLQVDFIFLRTESSFLFIRCHSSRQLNFPTKNKTNHTISNIYFLKRKHTTHQYCRINPHRLFAAFVSLHSVNFTSLLDQNRYIQQGQSVSTFNFHS